jgi:hypothetical protein
MALEVLHRSLVFLRCGEGLEGAQISSFGCLGVLFSRIQSIAARFELSDHGAAAWL